MRRKTLTLACLLVGLALVLVSYFFLSAPWGNDRIGHSNPRMQFAPLLTVLGVIVAFSSAIVYELLPDRDEAEKQ